MLDRKLIGKNLPAQINEVEKGAIRRFADAAEDPNPIYRDEAAARAAGYRGVVAPPTFAASLQSGASPLTLLGVEGRSILTHELSFEFHEPLCAGDRISVSSRLVELTDKPSAGGTIDFATIEDEGRNEQNQLVFRTRRTLLIQPLFPGAGPAS